MIQGCMVRDGATVVGRAWRTQNAWERMRGLLGRAPLGAGEGLLIAPCSSVHTVGMRYPIDVVYLTRDGVVLKLEPALPPQRLSQCLGAAMTLELPAGTAALQGIVPGQRLQWQQEAA